MEALVVEKSVQHRVVELSNYILVTTIPTKKVQKIVKAEYPKRGGQWRSRLPENGALLPSF